MDPSKTLKRISLKIVFMGMPNTHKAGHIRRYVDDMIEPRYKTMIGVDFRKKEIQRDGVQVDMILWDIAANDMSRIYLRDVDGAVILGNVKDKHFLEQIIEKRDYLYRIDQSPENDLIPCVAVAHINRPSLMNLLPSREDRAMFCLSEGFLDFYYASTKNYLYPSVELPVLRLVDYILEKKKKQASSS